MEKELVKKDELKSLNDEKNNEINNLEKDEENNKKDDTKHEKINENMQEKNVENNNIKNENTETGLHLKMVTEGEEIGTLDVESDEEDENE